eukprot:4640582-Alexandrium_andersonii.AAC.1
MCIRDRVDWEAEILPALVSARPSLPELSRGLCELCSLKQLRVVGQATDTLVLDSGDGQEGGSPDPGHLQSLELPDDVGEL